MKNSHEIQSYGHTIVSFNFKSLFTNNLIEGAVEYLRKQIQVFHFSNLEIERFRIL